MTMPIRPPRSFLILIAFLTALIIFAQLGLINIALKNLGLTFQSASSLLLLFLIGSLINLPLFKISATASPEFARRDYGGLIPISPQPFSGQTLIAINLGGGLLPVSLCIYLMVHADLTFLQILGGISMVSIVSFLFSRPIPGLGIAMPVLISPLTAALAALLLAPAEAAPLAYISGTLGVIVGADILRLKDIRKLGTPVASIGGAGTFDGIFITGIVAVLLASAWK